MPAPTYISQRPLPQPGSIGIQPIGLPRLPGGEIVGGALVDLGQAALRMQERLRAAADQTRSAQATTDYLTQLDQLETQYANSPDWQSAPTAFAADQAKLERQALSQANLDPQGSATLQLTLRQHGLASLGRVQGKAMGRQVASTVAALDNQEILLGDRAARAGSPIERQTQVAAFDKSVDGAVATGIITEDVAGDYKRRFRSNLEEAAIGNMVREHPDQAVSYLADPKNTAHIAPQRIEQLRDQASAARDQVTIDRLTAQAQRNPESASLNLGTVLDPAHGEAIFDRGILPIEGGVKDGVGQESPKGALGVGQILPDTAREMARKLGLNGVADLAQGELKALLLNDPVTNRRLSLAYWNQMLGRYNGNIALAAAAYNGGPGRADRWQAAAQAKFGDGFTAADLMSVIDVKETRDYVGELYTTLGGDPNGVRLTPHGFYRAVNAVQDELNRQASARRQAAIDLASAARSSDPIVEALKRGYGVDQNRVADYLATQEQAAAAGSSDAMAEVRRVKTYLGMKPAIDAAWSMAPAALNSEISRMEQTLAGAPDVAQADVDRLDAMKAVRDEQNRLASTDPVAAGERARFYKPVTIDTTAAPDDAALGQAFAFRAGQAASAAATYGGGLKPLHPDEAAALKERFAQGTAADQVGVLHTMGQAMAGTPGAYSAAVDQLGLTGYGKAAALFADARPALAKKILDGAAVLASKEAQATAPEVKQALAAKLGGDLWPSKAATASVVDAALAVYAANRGAAGSLWDASRASDVDAAVEEVTGPITTRGGVKVAAPPGTTAAAFDDALDHLTDGELAAFGGARDGNGNPIAAADIARYGVLRQLQPGSSRYAVGMSRASAPDGFAPVIDSAGHPLVLDMTALANAQAPAPAPVPTNPRESALRAEPSAAAKASQHDQALARQRAAYDAALAGQGITGPAADELRATFRRLQEAQ